MCFKNCIILLSSRGTCSKMIMNRTHTLQLWVLLCVCVGGNYTEKKARKYLLSLHVGKNRCQFYLSIETSMPMTTMREHGLYKTFFLSRVNLLHGQIVRSLKWGSYNLSSDWTNPFRFGPISPEFRILSPHKCYAGTACAHLCTTMKEVHSILPLQK